MAYHCYIGVTSGPLQNVATQLRDELAKKFQSSMTDWMDVSCETPEGQTLQWRKLRVLGKQELYYKDKDGQGAVPVQHGRRAGNLSLRKGRTSGDRRLADACQHRAERRPGRIGAAGGRKRQRQVTTDDEVSYVPQDRVVCRAVVVRVLFGLRRAIRPSGCR